MASCLLSDAELREDLAKDFVVGDFARDGAEMVDRLPDLFAEQVGGERLEAVEGGIERRAGVTQRFVMTAVGDDRFAVVKRRGVDGRTQSLQKRFHSPSFAGGERQRPVGQR